MDLCLKPYQLSEILGVTDMNKKDAILDFCKKENRKLTAREILNALFPGKPQPYINSDINALVYERKLVRENTRPYTVHVPAPGEIIGVVQNYSKGPQTRQNKKELDIATPCVAEVEKYLKAWEELENYSLQERSLNKLFLETYPSNIEIEDVLVKVATLNDFYSTQIFSVYPVAKHIVDLNIDERLKAGDISLVNDIATVKMESGDEKNFYSFATKYCSHHQPLNYAIYDSYVEKVLKYFRNVDQFSRFNDNDLKNYSVFSKVLLDFQLFYHLEAYNLKLLDRYLWQLGKDKFPKKYYR